MKSKNYWRSPNTGATNESEFSGLPGGYFISGGFVDLTVQGMWWSSSELNDTFGKASSLQYNDAKAWNGLPIKKSSLFSVRCVKDK